MAKNIDVYIYIGKSRSSAYQNGTVDNKPAEVGKTYKLKSDQEQGFIVIAVPRELQRDTEFSFNYWVQAEKIALPEE